MPLPQVEERNAELLRLKKSAGQIQKVLHPPAPACCIQKQGLSSKREQLAVQAPPPPPNTAVGQP